MNQFKRAKVVMLPTNGEKLQFECNCKNPEESHHFHCGLVYYNNRLCLNGKLINLYIISDDEIKEGDWFHLDMSDNDHPDEIHQMGKNNWSKTGGINFNNNSAWSKCCKKIIATTDTSLKPSCTCTESAAIYCGSKCQISLPQPSQQFIEKYIESYNKGNIITDVLVEYEHFDELGNYIDNNYHFKGDIWKLKINPKDNTITIKKIKNNWSKEEVIEFGNKIREYCKTTHKEDSLHKVFFEWDKWIEENL